METILQQTLKNLCLATGWCYAVFWKLKRRTRMVLTWEDGYFKYTKTAAYSNLASAPIAPNALLAGGNGCLETGGNPLEQGVCGQGGGCLEEQINLAVAKMSYHAYSLGEGVIGRVAFTGKHQWVFGSGECNNSDSNSGGTLNSRRSPEKYPSGWQNQFAAGIKTIAVIAVPQGVVQLGSTQTIMEDLHWVDHIKSVFGSLQGVPGAFLSDLVSEGQAGKRHGFSLAMTSAVMAAIRPTAAVGRTAALETQSAQKNVKSAPAAALGSLVSGSLGSLGSDKVFKSLPVLPPVCKPGDATKANLQQSQLQQAFLQPGTCATVVSSEMQASRSDVTLTGASMLQPFMGLLQTNYSAVSKHQMPLANTYTNVNNLKMTEQRQLKETCLPGHRQLPLNNFIADMPLKVNMDTSIDLQDTAPLATGCNQEQDNSFARLVCDEFPVTKQIDCLLGTSSVCGVQQLNALLPNMQTTSNVRIENSVNQNGGAVVREHGLSQHQLSSQGGDLSNSQACEGYLGIENCNMPLVQSHGNEQKLSGEVKQSPVSSWNSLAGMLGSELLENVGVSTSSGQGLLCFSESMLAQKGWVKDIWGTGIPSCTSQDTIESGKSVYKALEPILSDLPGSVGYNGSVAGEIDELDKYLTSFSRAQDKKWDCSFAIGDELSQALGPAFQKGHDKEFWEEILMQTSGEQVKGGFAKQNVVASGCSRNQTPAGMVQRLGFSFGKDLIKESKSEPLLDAIVGNASSIHQSTTSNPDDNFSCKTVFSGVDSGVSVLNSISKSDLSPSAHNGVPENIYDGYLQSVSQHEGLGNLHKTALVTDPQAKLPLQKSSKVSSPKPVLTTWMEEGHSIKSENSQPSQTRKSEETTKVSRKRARPGESTRPRPKDRQQIQDRVRELREIVPNGSKCSIDALLEKTIKHMLFLQSVTQHADKLKQSGEFKASKNENSLPAQDEIDSGASWAFELDDQGLGYPFIVQNLSQPRQMLVEILCEERGLFLEIADIIRSLGLTILKGVMESRTDKIWARFVVEANRDVERVDILWSLIQLLRPTNYKNSSSVNSQAGPGRPPGMDNSPQAFCGFQQASLPPLHMNERLQ